MLFYDDFLKKLENNNISDIKKEEKFRLDFKKSLGIYGISIPLLLISVQAYLILNEKALILAIASSLGIAFIALKQIFTALKYKITINTETNILTYEKVEINLNDVKTCELKEARIGKSVNIVIDLVLEDKRRIVIPFYMTNKLRFSTIMKDILKEKFEIIK